MSWQASAWALTVPLDSSSAAHLLLVIANYADENSVCWPSQRRLSKDSKQSVGTVKRRLAELEELGVIVRLPTWIGTDGKRNHEARGAQTSDEIRLLVDLDFAQLEAKIADRRARLGLKKAAFDDSDEDDAATSDSGPPSNLTPPQALAPPSNLDPRGSHSLGPGGESQPDSTGESLLTPQGTSTEPSLEPALNKTPPNPPSGGLPDISGSRGSEAAGEQKPGTEWPHAASWARFEKAWQEPILHQTICRQIWSAFTPDEQEQAIVMAAGYVKWRGGQKRPPNVCNAQKALRERDAWPQFAALAPPQAKPPAPPPEKTWIAAGSDEFKALALMMAAGRMPPLKAVQDPERGAGTSYLGKAPRGAAALAALARFDASGAIDKTGWHLHGINTPIYTAWCERIKEWTGEWPREQRIWLDAAGNPVATVQQAEGYGERMRLPKCKDGLLLPSEQFPPAKGQDRPNHAPPLSDADAAEFR